MKEDAQKSGPFSRLHHISIVVKDIEQAEKYYTSIGIGPFEDYPPMEEYTTIDVPDEKGFYNLVIKWTQIGPVQLQIIQPGEGESLYKDFLEQKGEGVYHLGFVVDDIEAAQLEVSRLGLGVISSGRRENGTGFAYLDTAESGGVTLLVRQSPPPEQTGCERPRVG
jgi:catechol 2,3-dioxygenase-like lactoylglutathione lyase family enzyme